MLYIIRISLESKMRKASYSKNFYERKKKKGKVPQRNFGN
jgi:hypothetical protein